ncbi:hypothetical protein ACFRLW_26580, partial [Streptomyces sp. NPDC056728]
AGEAAVVEEPHVQQGRGQPQLPADEPGERTGAGDGRRSLLRLTDDGTRIHRKLTVRTARMNQIFLAPLSADEQAVFFDLIQRVSDAAEGLRNPTEPLAKA